MNKLVLSFAVFGTVSFSTTLVAQEAPVAAQEQNASAPIDVPVIDITKDPGCGIKGLTKEQKIDRSRRLAQIFFQSYVEAVKTKDHLYNWRHHKCWAPNATSQDGTMRPGVFVSRATSTYLNAPIDIALTEMNQIWKAMPNYRAIPGTLTITPWENGAVFQLKYAGNTPAGKYYEVWELDMFRVNDDGLITHYEFWNTTPEQMENIIKVIYGRSTSDIGANEGYGGMLQNFNKKEEASKKGH